MKKKEYLSPEIYFMDTNTQSMLAGESIMIVRDDEENVDHSDDIYARYNDFSIWDDELDD